MLKKIDKIQELLNVPNVDASTETAIANMKILNLLVDLRAEAEQLILSGVVASLPEIDALRHYLENVDNKFYNKNEELRTAYELGASNTFYWMRKEIEK